MDVLLFENLLDSFSKKWLIFRKIIKITLKIVSQHQYIAFFQEFNIKIFISEKKNRLPKQQLLILLDYIEDNPSLVPGIVTTANDHLWNDLARDLNSVIVKKK